MNVLFILHGYDVLF